MYFNALYCKICIVLLCSVFADPADPVTYLHAYSNLNKHLHTYIHVHTLFESNFSKPGMCPQGHVPEYTDFSITYLPRPALWY